MNLVDMSVLVCDDSMFARKKPLYVYSHFRRKEHL